MNGVPASERAFVGRKLTGGARNRPDYSPRMLRLFLRARIVFRAVMDGVSRERARKLVSAEVRKAARITHAQFDFALAGHRTSPTTRAAIWGALGILPDRELTAED